VVEHDQRGGTLSAESRHGHGQWYECIGTTIILYILPLILFHTSTQRPTLVLLLHIIWLSSRVIPWLYFVPMDTDLSDI
jgi:hypothetical protein